MSDNKHHGKTLERILRDNGVVLTELASQIHIGNTRGIDRATIYNWFKQERLPTDKLLAVCRASVRLKAVPENLIHELELGYPNLKVVSVVEEEREEYRPNAYRKDRDLQRECDAWKQKYIEQLEYAQELYTTLLSTQKELHGLKSAK